MPRPVTRVDEGLGQEDGERPRPARPGSATLGHPRRYFSASLTGSQLPVRDSFRSAPDSSSITANYLEVGVETDKC
jgi:hypothetical protein